MHPRPPTAPAAAPPRTRLRTLATVAIGAALLLGTPASLPHLTDTPIAPTAGQAGPSWADEPSAATLAAAGAAGAGHGGDDRPRAEQFYFALPDRFFNGDPANDTGGLAGGRLDHGYDPTDKGFYHGGDL